VTQISSDRQTQHSFGGLLRDKLLTARQILYNNPINISHLKIYRILFWLTLCSGLIILAIGVYLKMTNQLSNGIYTTRYGTLQQGSVSGFSAIILGIFLLLISIYVRICNKKEQDKFDKME